MHYPVHSHLSAVSLGTPENSAIQKLSIIINILLLLLTVHYPLHECLRSGHLPQPQLVNLVRRHVQRQVPLETRLVELLPLGQGPHTPPLPGVQNVHLQHTRWPTCKTEHLHHTRWPTGKTEHLHHTRWPTGKTEHLLHTRWPTGKTEHLQHTRWPTGKIILQASVYDSVFPHGRL